MDKPLTGKPGQSEIRKIIMDYGQPKYSQVLLGLLILSKNEIIGFRKKTIVLENEPLVLNFQKTKSDRF